MVNKAQSWLRDGFYNQHSPECKSFLEQLEQIRRELQEARLEVYEEIKDHLRENSSGEEYHEKLFAYNNGEDQLMNEYNVERLNPVGSAAVERLRQLYSGL